MKIPRMPLLLIFLTLAVFGGFQNSWAQWAFLKASLHTDVRTLTETENRLVLCRQDSTALLIVTVEKSSDSDIFGGIEVRRGSNPYRVWVTTENFWRKPHLSADGGRKFFQHEFVKILRTEESMRDLAPSAVPEETEIAPETLAPIPDEAPAEVAAEEVHEEEPVAEPIAAENVETDSLREQAEPVVPAFVTKPPQPPTPSKTAGKNRRTGRSARSTRAARSTKGSLPKQQAAQVPMLPPVVASVPPAANLDSLYQAALTDLEQENWAQAIVALEKLQLMQPNYRDVAEHLVQARIRRDLAARTAAPTVPRMSGKPSLFAGGAWAAIGAFVALIVLPMLGVIFFSTGFRARFQMFRGNHAEAARLYEKKLARRPGKTKIYTELANAYLFLGRRDEQALKVFKTVLQLKLRTKNHEAINAIVAQSYLAESKSDTSMIEVLENALKAERRRLRQGPGQEG
jgi:tetratricopeptide (TPR) repeat protein